MSTVCTLSAKDFSKANLFSGCVAGQLKEFVEPRASINVFSKSRIKMSEFLFSRSRRDTNCNLIEIVKKQRREEIEDIKTH